MYGLNQNKFFSETGYEIADEPLLASLFTTGNGYMGVRGSFEEFGSLRIQGAFVRGYIDEIIEVCEPFADNEYMKKYYLNEEGLKRFERQDSCVNMPDFLLVRIRVGDKTFYPWEGRILSWNRYLNSSTAEYIREVVWDDGAGHKTRFRFRRFASFACRHLYCQQVTVTPLGHSLPVSFVSGVDTAVKTGGQFITETLSLRREGDDLFYSFRAKNKYRFAAAYAIRQAFPKGRTEGGFSENGCEGVVHICDPAREYVFEKVTTVLTERDIPAGEDLTAQAREIYNAQDRPYATLRRESVTAYKKYFANMDVVIEGDDQADGYLRFASYHTAISAERFDSVHGISAKGLTGERYNQFVWWDNEIHQIPFFIMTAPETAKNALTYRYRMLGAAKKNAAENGKHGAMYAFCSSVEGDERVWGYVRHPFMQVHIDSDIPYGIIHYYRYTGDRAFMTSMGMEMIHECLRFWCDRVTERNGRYEILQVTGTDEHHPYVDNDAYTNYCVAFIFTEFLSLAKEFGYPLTPEESGIFRDISERLYRPQLDNGMIPQFDGYFDLSRGLEEAGRGTLKQFQMKKSGLYHKSQIIKQPDVALLYTMVDVGVDRTHYAENWDYYEQMCESSSSLTFPVHAIASAHNHRMLSFYRNFMDTLKIDVNDIHGVGWQGVHSGCLAGGYLAVMLGLFGVQVKKDGLLIAPNPMPFFEKITAHMLYKGTRLELVMQGGKVTIRRLRGASVRVILRNGETVKLHESLEIE